MQGYNVNTYREDELIMKYYQVKVINVSLKSVGIIEKLPKIEF